MAFTLSDGIWAALLKWELNKNETSKSGVWTQISMIETQLFTTWATESGRLIDVLDGTLELSFI